LGDQGFIAYNKDKGQKFSKRQHFPSLISNPVDVAGAGDSLLASVSLATVSGGSIMESSVIGAFTAALSVQSMGNNPIKKLDLINYITNIMEQ
jgi:bifunctional ADP-heptose synthase (sugar kinase/adenylyltransferase)